MQASYQDALFPYLVALLILSPIVAGLLTGLTATQPADVSKTAMPNWIRSRMSTSSSSFRACRN
jgi:hypothetical protein